MSTKSLLQKNIEKRRTEKSVLVMSHTVMGYPSLAYNHEQVKTLAESGVDIIELQFPFSDPMADGPVLSKANQESLENGTTIGQCFTETEKITSAFPKAMFVIMTYYNVIYAYGKEAFLKKAKECGIQGIIVPDLPPDETEAHEYVKAADATDIATIFLCTPFTSKERLNYIAQYARGLIYCVARLGTTGRHTKFGAEFEAYINNVKKSFTLPIGVGFGVQTSDDVNHLKRVGADIAIICSHVIKMSMEKGLPAVKEYLTGIGNATK
ncbi:MAG TPA: tryptophan synthase subunit alpha [Chitinispirillaceae bacterium]|nr:tryptophan synthase subunit alpha [Chitinispirillaceae bacterium]